jgi:hypothetical protein
MPKKPKLSKYFMHQNLPKRGELFGVLKVTGKFKTKGGYKFYEVVCPHGFSKFKKASELRYGRTKSCRFWEGCPAYRLAQVSPEFVTVKSHYYCIFVSKHKKDKTYKGVHFHDGWNPKKGGSFYEGYKWIIDNIGKRPKNASLHIIDHEKGFAPGNLEWATSRKQSNQQMYKIIAQLKHQIRKFRDKIKRIKNVRLPIYQ